MVTIEHPYQIPNINKDQTALFLGKYTTQNLNISKVQRDFIHQKSVMTKQKNYPSYELGVIL